MDRFSPESPFVRHRDAMLLTAVQIYQAEALGDPSHDIVPHVMPLAVGDLSPQALAKAEAAQAEVLVGARVLARHAGYADRIGAGGLQAVFGKAERKLALITGDKRYLREELDPAGLIAAIRRR